MPSTSLKLTCPTCGRVFECAHAHDSMPFCSAACKMVDLGRWMNEAIGVPHHAVEDQEADEPVPPPPVREWKFD